MNSATPDAAVAALLTCCGSHRWARRIAAHRPYPDLEALLAASDEAAYDLAPDDLAEALACEPLDLFVPQQDNRGNRADRGAPHTTYTAAHTALRAAHAAYESRFGHSFVICLDDVAPEEALDHLLSGIRSRLGNDPDEETALAAEELRRTARGRLTRLVLCQAAKEAAQTAGHAAHGHQSQALPDSPYVPV
ncbi:2-oxo-4-hydroxy-4-carboxy-5-ureidoimidazoline decarboxylase [Streptomyces sp. Je 1-369]|uniref:2-oxo-4-hydroxy-4-carboxy-5-ureidoimidazoline decarboxylase n=1 Tax=Streptomyces sp. Je 1-369 TaxID=2966192 RepID=UPI002AA29DD2|nr:2-oxo-4-hydroxy-4-carboxy-5-ureidoimidazoline decarboxylase [Streptomyces sp. Je 1-369]